MATTRRVKTWDDVMRAAPRDQPPAEKAPGIRCSCWFCSDALASQPTEAI